MAKQKAEWSNKLSTFFLKKHGYFDNDYSHRSGGITWTYGYSENKNSIGFTVKRDNWGTPEEQTYIILKYINTSRWTNEKENIEYRVELTTTPCNYGGKRYWFICPLIKNGKYCRRRVGTLFGIGKWFGCRHCGEINYTSQMKSGTFRASSISIPDLEKAQEEIKRYYYNGNPTRKYRKLLRMENMFDRDLLLMAARIDKRFKEYIPRRIK